MTTASGELPEQPGFDGAEAEVIAGGGVSGLRQMVEHPTDLAGAEIRIQQQTGALAPALPQTGFAPVATDVGSATVLPHQCGSTGETAAAAPEHRCLPLVGDAATQHRRALTVVQLPVQLDQGLKLAAPDRLRILFHPAVSGVVDRQRC